MPSENLLTPKNVADMLGVSVDTVHRLAHKKEGLKAYKVGRLTRFKPSEVEAYIVAQTVKVPEKQVPLPGMQRFKYKPGMKIVKVG